MTKFFSLTKRIKGKSDMKKIICLIFILLTFSACGRGQNEDNDTAGENGGAFGVHLGDSFTLTISTPTGNANMNIEAAANSLTNRLAAEGIDVHINIEAYIWEERDNHFDRKLGQFAAGMGPDIFVLDGFLLYPFLENGFLQDIYPMIDASENWSREDFFENVLRGHEIGGRLYAMPMSFGFDFVGINANAPREFLERFGGLDYISMDALARLYLELIHNFPEWGDYAFINTATLYGSVGHHLDVAVDFAGRDVNFPQNTVDAFQDLRNAYEGNDRFDTELIFVHSEENLQLLQDRYVFFRPIGVSGPFEALFEFQTTYFTNFVPIADNSGNLRNTDWWGIELAVNANADGTLAWAFIEELLAVTAERGGFGDSSHISRRHARHYLEAGFDLALTQFIIRPILGSQSNAISQAADRIIIYSDMPISRSVTSLFLPTEAYIDAFREFEDGNLTAEEAISRLEASITEWFAAVRQPVAPYEPAEEIVHDGPVQTLTVRTPNNQTGVLEQAADKMNASWQERGIPYAFVLIVEDWSWADWEDAEGRITRLGIELMAGDGPDMFLFENHDIRTFAERGFLADINNLIENHPASNRSDFYENILYSLEINGGLYMFPISFGFYRVAVNTSIPQPFVDRFMGYTSISFAQMLDFYLDFKQAHGQEFGHFVPGVSSSFAVLQSAVASNMSPFIDFDASLSNLNSPEFVAILNSLMQVFSEHEFIASFWVTNAVGNDFLIGRAEEQLFEMGSFNMMGAEAFFSRPEPFFTNYIPVTDDEGRLLFNITGDNTWASWVIPAAGNPTLAWEFITYLLEAYYEPVGRAAVEPVWGSPTSWAGESLGSPIVRAHFESKTRRALEQYSRFPGLGFSHSAGSPERNQEIDNAINTLALQNEMPVVLLNPLFPPLVFELINDPLENLRLGLITAEAAAQQIHNSIQLWLLE